MRLSCVPILSLLAVACDNTSKPAGPQDAVWCDVIAIPCVKFVGDTVEGVPPGCTVEGTTLVPATPPGGFRVCFDSASVSPEEACAALCGASMRSPVSAMQFPRRESGNCLGTVNTDTHPGVNSDGFAPSSCIGEMVYTALLSAAGTNSVTVTATATVTYGDQTQSVSGSGRFNIAAPKTPCWVGDSSCFVQINELELAFDDVTFPDLTLRGWSLFLDGPVLTPPGAVNPVAPTHFNFDISEGTAFDLAGDISPAPDGAHAILLRSDRAVSGILDLATGEVITQFSAGGTINGKQFTLNGDVSTVTVVDQAPVVALPPATSVAGAGDPDPLCCASVTLSATAFSPVGLPVALTFAVDDWSPALPGPNPSTNLCQAGDHLITVLAVDTLGAFARATQTITVICP